MNKIAEPEAANLAGWRIELERLGHPFANSLQESTDPYAIAVSLGLPIPQYVPFESPASFLTNVAAGLEPLTDNGVINYHVALRPRQDGLPKHRNIDKPLALDEVVPYVTNHVPLEQYAAYSLRIAEYAVAVYGIVLVINPSGSQHADIVIGDLGPLATGRRRPDYQVRTDPSTGVRRFTRVDPQRIGNLSPSDDRRHQINHHPVITEEARQVIVGAIKKIPRLGPESRDPQLPGRFEIAVVRHADSRHLDTLGSLVAMYVDAQPDEAGRHPYAVPEEQLY